METLTRKDEAATPEAVEPAGRRSRLWSRFAAVFAVVGAVLFGSVGVASATPLPTPSDLGDASAISGEAASTVSSSLLSSFTTILPYVVVLLVAFTVWAYVRGMFGTKKRPH